jgi:predicted O-methyltransferase YrrM
MCKNFCIFAAYFSQKPTTEREKPGMSRDIFHRIWSYARHVLTAWNTTGEGIHSPYLFYLVRFVLRDRNSFYCFADIESRRALLEQCEDVLDVVDYGSAGSPEGVHVQRRVCDIAKGHLENARMGQLLFRMVAYMSHETKRPLEILELGTSLGITTAYLAKADSRNKVVTLEGSEAVAKVAQGVWKALVTENIQCHIGRIEETLGTYAGKQLDVVYVDANHTYEATMRYVDFLLPRMAEKGVIIVDDIHYSTEMERAWKAIKKDKRVTSTIDVWHAGIVFVDRHYLKRHYRMRI